MKYFFIFLGILGVCLLIAVTAALFVGVPIEQHEVTKVIKIRK